MAEPFYLNGPFYDAMHQGVSFDIGFYVQEAKACQGPVLELACGTGRITLPLARAGVQATGLDLQASMLAQAAAKAGAEGLQVGWVQGDCRGFSLPQRYSLIFIAFNSLLHLHDHPSLLAFLGCCKRHLRPDGRLIIDIFNPSVGLLAAPGEERYRVQNFTDPETGEAAFIEELRHYDALSQVNRITWFCSSATRKDYLVHDLHLRCIFPQELALLVDQGGYDVQAAYGDHKRSPLMSASPRQILALRPRPA